MAGSVSSALAQSSYDYAEVQKRANRFFAEDEWASAGAMFNFMLRERPTDPDTYGRAIVSAEMLGDRDRSMQLLSEAMEHHVPLDSVLANVQEYSFAKSHGNLYEQFMLDAAATHAWLARPLDAYLLDYYIFRRNGEKMIEYAQKMLAGLPKSTRFLAILAEGYMLTDRPDDALETRLKIYEIDPDDYTNLINLATFYDLTAHPAEALPYYRKAYKILPTPFVNQRIKEISATR